MLTSDRSSDLELFRSLGREPRLHDWLSARLENEKTVLIQMVDIEQIRKAQGRAQLLREMIALLEAAKKLP